MSLFPGRLFEAYMLRIACRCASPTIMDRPSPAPACWPPPTLSCGWPPRLDDEARALHYYSEAHRLWPVDLDVISWLGAHHVRGEVYERAVPYFELAALVQPQEPKWALMVASCFRRIGGCVGWAGWQAGLPPLEVGELRGRPPGCLVISSTALTMGADRRAYRLTGPLCCTSAGALPQALARYKQVHAAHPTNVECLRYLVHLCSELGRRDDAQEYAARLKRAERLQVWR